MDFLKGEHLIIFILFFIPGFISIKVYDLFVPGENRDFSKSFFEVVAYSCFNYAVNSIILILIFHYDLYESVFWLFLILVAIVIFIIPILLPVLLLKFRKSKRLSKYIISPYSKPWDYFFSKKEAYWIIVHLKDGRKIGGIYGENSFSSSFPYEEQLYLEKVWKLDDKGGFKVEIERTEGIIIFNSEILAVEFFK